MPRSNPPYSAEFRARAIDLVRTSGKPVTEVAKDLGISTESLRNWIRQAEINAGRGQPGDLTSEEREELRRLKRENRILREEREILKKAAAFFARENETR